MNILGAFSLLLWGTRLFDRWNGRLSVNQRRFNERRIDCSGARIQTIMSHIRVEVWPGFQLSGHQSDRDALVTAQSGSLRAQGRKLAPEAYGYLTAYSIAAMDASEEVDTIPVGPKPIRKLDEEVVNQIAAAEVSPDSAPLEQDPHIVADGMHRLYNGQRTPSRNCSRTRSMPVARRSR